MQSEELPGVYRLPSCGGGGSGGGGGGSSSSSSSSSISSRFVNSRTLRSARLIKDCLRKHPA